MTGLCKTHESTECDRMWQNVIFFVSYPIILKKDAKTDRMWQNVGNLTVSYWQNVTKVTECYQSDRM